VFLYDTLPHNEWPDEPVKEIPMTSVVDVTGGVIHVKDHDQKKDDRNLNE
jgi:hypothetical protein